MSKHFTTSDGFKIDGFDNANDFTKALREWDKKQEHKRKMDILKKNNEEEKNNEK
jgi:hypothetical protein|tara:strand:+ start:540 stop:704 length:165 start_codon:yes stop_codon:yes gene_type:complete